VSEPSSVNDQHRQELLRSSAAFATARLAFANAIVIAQRAGETDEEIAHVCGLDGADDPRTPLLMGPAA
jgi:hypothetical protein